MIIDKAIKEMPTIIKKKITDSKDTDKKVYYTRQSEVLPDVLTNYRKQMADRTYPLSETIVSDWKEERDPRKANKELKTIVDFIAKTSVKYKDRNSLEALIALKKVIDENCGNTDKLGWSDREKATSPKLKKIIDTLATTIKTLEDLPPTDEELKIIKEVEEKAPHTKTNIELQNSIKENINNSQTENKDKDKDKDE